VNGADSGVDEQVWRAPKAVIGTCFVGLLIAYVVVMTDPGSALTRSMFLASILVLAGCVALVYWTVVRPRLILTANEIVIVKWFRTVRVPLVDVVAARAAYYGLTFSLADGSTRECSCLQTPNYARWLGRPSRADRVGAYVVGRAAAARGETPQSPAEDEISRTPGNLVPGILQALVALFNH